MKSDNSIKKQSTLDKIDAYYESKPKSIFLMSILMLVMMVGYLVYDYSYEDSENYLNEQNEELRKASEELESLNNYIEMQKSQNTLARLQADLATARKRLDEAQQDNQYFDIKLKEVSRVLYNQKNLTEFLSKLISSSKGNSVTTIGIRSRRNDFGMQKIQEAFNVEFSLVGSYQGVLNFLNELEQSQDVVDVKTVKVMRFDEPAQVQMNNPSASQPVAKPAPSGKNQIFANVFISIWGLKY